MSAHTVKTYPAPEGAVGNSDYSVRLRTADGEWQSLFSYNVKVDMHDVRNASMVMFDCSGEVEMEVHYHVGRVRNAVVRPLSYGIKCDIKEQVITFKIDQPRLLSLEVNGGKFNNLHIFANPLSDDPVPVESEGEETMVLKPGMHQVRELNKALKNMSSPRIIFGPGIHRLDESRLEIPSHTTVCVAGGAVIYGGLICNHVQDVTIKGRGILYMSDFEKTTYYRGVEVKYSSRIHIEGITVIDPPHYTVLLGQSDNIRIRNLKTFSTRGWCDGIDMMACQNVLIEGGFLRTSDDCIAVYASRGEFQGNTQDVTVKGSTLWADVAHPINIGTHGNYDSEGDHIENLHFADIDILEHHEPQPDYWGCLAINAGDNNTVRNVTYEDIRIEDFELGELFNLRVLKNEKYNPAPGKRIENIHFKNIHYSGTCNNPSHIEGYDESRTVSYITFENVTVNGEKFALNHDYVVLGNHVHGVKLINH
ncbi:glycosyl hydrolase family 28 protein [Paenibacillus sp. FSL W8-0426]|uniref:glycosyl hydrolase family 28 protein n=1 Tax=Paenibacillus sp. FSL W8-0426 TaxID=2921714 RepID=UPI0030DDAF92